MTDRPAEPPWALSAREVAAAFDSPDRGLSAAEAAARMARHGPNRLPEPPRPGALVRFLRQFDNLLILVLLAAAGITALLGHWVDTGVILAVVLANTIIGFVQEGRAEQALAALRQMLAPQAAVWRDGTRITLPAEELVPGDRVWLEAGDRVPADLRLVDVQGLTVEEAILTGESVPVRKSTGTAPAEALPGDRKGMAFSGTMVVEGTATGVVTATGPATEIGRISGMIAGVERLETPLTVAMGRLARQITAFVLVVAAAVLALTVLVRGMPFAEGFMIVVGLFVAAIPEGLPAVLTVTLAIGVQVMARRHAIVRRLPAIETLGALSVICSDKTGTLTRNEMVVTQVVTATGAHGVEGQGYAPEGAVQDPDPTTAAMARIAALCNTAALVRDEEDGWRTEGDPMEGALLAFAGRAGADWDDRPAPVATLPFDSRTRYMAVLHGGEILVKGAPEAILPLCAGVLTADGTAPIDPDAWHETADSVAAAGQRVLAFALAPKHGPTLDHGDLAELTFVGLAGLIDPPRPEAVEAVADCHAAGIAVKMITGDHAGTAAAIGRQIGLRRTERVLTGAEIEAMDDATLAQAVDGVDVFARTSPEHKLRLVTALQAGGAVVAMTGDGVNDAPALARADAGIAMGLKGSAATREAADLVLTDDNFASIAEAVRRGRTVQANLRKVVSFLLPVNGGESISLILAVLFALTLPITPLQILWVNMVSSVALAMALAFEGPERDVMRRPPRRRDAPILSRFVLWRVFLVSMLFAAGVFGSFEAAQALGADIDRARTVATNALVAMEVFYLFSIRYRLGTALTWEGVRGTPAVLIAVLLVCALQAAFTWAPPMQALFGTVGLSLAELAACAGLGVAVLLILDFDSRVARWRKSAQNPARNRA
ncbi:MAG: cation-translocating P-type ATPase [Gemmobacter sp.]